MKLVWRVLNLVLLIGVAVLILLLVRHSGGNGPYTLVFPGANSRTTYFSMHHIGEAQEITRGAGVKVGILDHLFGTEVHPDL